MQLDRSSQRPNILINPDREGIDTLLHHKAGGAALFCIMEDGSVAELSELGDCHAVIARAYRGGYGSDPEPISTKGLEGADRELAIKAGIAAAWMNLEIASMQQGRHF